MFLLGNWAFIFLYLEGFFKKTLPKSNKENIHYLTYPQPDPISPPKKHQKHTQRPWKNAWASSGKNSWPGIPGRHGPKGWLFFGVEGFPPQKFQCWKRKDISPAPACFNSSWFLVVLVTLLF